MEEHKNLYAENATMKLIGKQKSSDHLDAFADITDIVQAHERHSESGLLLALNAFELGVIYGKRAERRERKERRERTQKPQVTSILYKPIRKG